MSLLFVETQSCLLAQVTSARHLPSAMVVGVPRDPTLRRSVPSQQLDSTGFLRLGITTTADAMRRLAGVNIKDYGGAGGLKTVSVRGLGAAHTAVVYDGVTLSNAQSGAIDIGRFPINRLSQISLNIGDAEQLLVPARQLAAATLVLTSRLPNTLRTGWHGAVQLRQCAFNVWQPSWQLVYAPDHRQAVNLSVDYLHGRNNYPYIVKNGIATHREKRNNSQINDWTGEMNYMRLWKGGELTAKAYGVSNHRYLPGMVYLYNNDHHEHLTEKNAFGQLRWVQTLGNWRMAAAAKYDARSSQYFNADKGYIGGSTEQIYHQQEHYATLGTAYHHGHWSAALSTDYAYHTLRSNLSTDATVSRHSWLTALSVRYSQPRLLLTARLIGAVYRNRTDKLSETARNAQRLTPSLSVAWQVWHSDKGSLYLRAHLKNFFRMPTFTENYYFHLGNQRLKPENTYQAGGGLTFQRSLSPRWNWQMTADAYYNRVTDKIVSVPFNLFVWQTTNWANVRAGGLDMTSALQFRPTSNQLLQWQGQISCQRITDRSERSSNAYGHTIPYSAPCNGSAALAWENPWLNVSASFHAVAQRWSSTVHLPDTHLKGYMEWGFGLYRTWRLNNSNLTARADLINAFNARYEVVRRYPMPGRAYQIQLVYSF